jgi:hypothetical protein
MRPLVLQVRFNDPSLCVWCQVGCDVLQSTSHCGIAAKP